jgi:Gpi18-like mannosyltransferase
MPDFFKKHKKVLLLGLILVVAFILRLFLVDKIIVGDLLAYLEWGQRYRDWGGEAFYFGKHPWLYSAPNYPPISTWIFAGLSWLFERRYWTAQLHNLIKFPPAVFIIYYYKYGEILLYKLLPIFSDLGLGVIIFAVINKLTKNYTKAIWGAAFFLLNPVTIFLSGGWGQTDSFVALVGIISFLLLSSKKYALSMLLFFFGMYFKPTWGLMVPFYLYVLYLKKPPLKSVLLGLLLMTVTLVIVSFPFAEGNLFLFTKKVWFDRYFLPIKSAGRASSSAFNFMTIFLKIDRDLFNAKILGLIPANLFGLLSYLVVNVFAFKYVKEHQNQLLSILVGLFVIGMGSFLFMSNMLERYFFAAYVPMIIVMFCEFKTFLWGLILNLILTANLFWSFYRRSSDEIDHPFTNNNFLLIRILSTMGVVSFIKFFLTLKRVKI